MEGVGCKSGSSDKIGEGEEGGENYRRATSDGKQRTGKKKEHPGN